MNEYLDQIAEVIKFLQTKLHKDSSHRPPNLSTFTARISEGLHNKLGSALAQAQLEEANIIRPQLEKLPATDTLHKQKAGLLLKVNKAGSAIIRFESLLRTSMISLHAQAKGCMEHTTLMMLALIKHFSTSGDFRFESVVVSMKENAQANHNFVVFNRKGQIDNVSSWGEECLVIDSSSGIIRTPSTMPKGSSVYNMLHYPGVFYNVRVEYDNQFGLQDLQKFPEGHLFHNVELISRRFLQEYLQGVIDREVENVALPWLSTPVIEVEPRQPSTCSYSSMFQAAPHDELVRAIQPYCLEKKYNNFVAAVYNKAYSLALRLACARCDLNLIRLLLSFKNTLNIDVNDPTKRSGRTALDCIMSCPMSKDREIGIGLLEEHGAVSGESLLATTSGKKFV